MIDFMCKFLIRCTSVKYQKIIFFDLHWRHAHLAADASNLLLKGAFHWTEPQDTILITFWSTEREYKAFLL